LLPQHCSRGTIEGRFELGGRVVELGKITCPILNVYAKEDHIIPPATSQALGKAQALLGSGIADWLAKRD
jgi:polyhydroxyalkanoate synthase